MTDRQLRAQKYLEQIKHNEQIMQSHMEELTALRDFSTSISAATWDKERIQDSGPQEARFVKSLERIVDLEKAIDSEMGKMLNLRMEITGMINSVSNRSWMLLLRYRYIECLKWDDIEEKMHCSMRTVFTIHEKALSEIANMIDKIAA